MNNKKYRGLVVVAPPHLNPKQESDRYVFSGVAVPSGEAVAHLLRVIALPGSVSPRQFAAEVTAQNPLPGDLELFFPAFDLGRFSYFRPSTGKYESAQADDVTTLMPEKMHPLPSLNLTQPEPELAQPQPEESMPGLEF